MWMLKRMIWPYEVRKCDASGEIMMYGDFFYEDDETGKVVSKKFYDSKYKEKRDEEWEGRKRLEGYESQKEYMDAKREAEREALANSMFDNTMFDHFSSNYEKGWERK